MKNRTVIPPKTPNERYTDNQWQAIYDQGDNLLVSASAGSGKTAVLVRRVIEKIKRDHLSVDQLLVVTFTEAAAAEMKERIQSALQEAINEESDQALKNHFTRQLALLPLANISTLHAFCSKVIQRFFYLIELDPTYRMLTDETETLLLKEDVWDELREQFYGQEDPVFYRLTENFSSDRSDDGLTMLILALYEFARANPEPFTWLDSLLKNYQVTQLTDSPLYQTTLKPDLLLSLENSETRYQQMIQLTEADDTLLKINQLAATELQAVQQIKEKVAADELTAAFELAQGMSFERYPSPRGKKATSEIKEVSNQAKAQRDLNKTYLTDLKTKGLFAVAPEQQVAHLQAAGELVAELVRVEKAFITQFTAKKREKGLLDFNDLEHFALQILQTAEAGEYYRGRFQEVLVDEYQDTNQLQETILQQLTRTDPGNLFMVGDVKQSIYGFRLANPTLFIEKYHRFAHEAGGRRIILAENFRSRKEVLDFTNLIFKQLMDEQVGQIEYDQEAELVNGFPDFPASSNFATELLIYEKDAPAPDWIEDKTAGEIYLTGLKIRELVDQGFEIYDKKSKAMRPIAYQDIVLLAPTKNNNLTILDVFKELNIPLEINDTQNYFQTTELQMIISLLQVIDNPYQDIPLVAVLRSPIAGLDEEELAQIRISDRQTDFYQASQTYCKQNHNETSEKLTAFYQHLTTWREFARREALADLLWKIYDETAYLDYVLGLPAGAQRHANLLALVDRSKDYEKTSFRGLYQFIRFIEKMREKDKDLGEVQKAENTDAVRVMTIHGSKGLEFPVVFLLDLSKEFNVTDLRKNYVFDEALGLGIKFLDPQRVRISTLAFDAVRKVKAQKLLSEELRKLYVALTRAEQKLFLVGSYADQAEAVKTWSKAAAESELVLGVKLRDSEKNTPLNLIGQALFRHPKLKQNDYDVVKLPTLQQDQTPFELTFITPEEIEQHLATFTAETSELPEVQVVDVKEFEQQLNFMYPYQEATTTTSYQSVSELKRLYDDPDNRDADPLSLEQTTTQTRYRFTADGFEAPRFLQQTELSATEIGSATHLVMQLLPLEETITAEFLADFINGLVTQKTLTPEIATAIDQQAILAFLATDLGQLLQKDVTRLSREEPFAMLLPAQQVFKEYQAADSLLVHGIIDGYVEYDDHLVVYDFKTDQFSAARKDALIARYRGQLYLYKEALEKAKGKPVTSLNLIFLRGQQTVDLLENFKS